MAQILPPKGGLGQTFGTGLGSGLGQLLQGLAGGANKAAMGQQLQQEGLPSLLANLDPQVQAQYLRGAQAAQTQQAAQNQKDLAQQLIENIRGGQPQGAIQPMEQGEEEFQPQFKQTAEGNLYTPVSQRPKRLSEEQRISAENRNFQSFLDRPDVPANQKFAIQEAVERNQKRLDKIKENREKKFGKGLEKLHDEYATAKERLGDYKRLEELNESGELPSTSFASFLSGANLKTPALLGTAGEEFQKITQNFVRRAKEYYGGRITDRELEQFLRTVPSLEQSPEGRKRVIAQMRRLDKMKTAAYKSAQNIIRDNDGVAPEDLWERVDKKLKKQRKSLAERFKNDLERPVPEPSNRLAVGAANVAGHAFWPGLGAGAGLLVGGPLGAAVGGVGGFGASKLAGLLNSLGS